MRQGRKRKKIYCHKCDEVVTASGIIRTGLRGVQQAFGVQKEKKKFQCDTCLTQPLMFETKEEYLADLEKKAQRKEKRGRNHQRYMPDKFADPSIKKEKGHKGQHGC